MTLHRIIDHGQVCMLLFGIAANTTGVGIESGYGGGSTWATNGRTEMVVGCVPKAEGMTWWTAQECIGVCEPWPNCTPQTVWCGPVVEEPMLGCFDLDGEAGSDNGQGCDTTIYPRWP